ncbi:MAG: peptidylprolyl isomerase [Deltaproteobacteria bacterium]|nr:peptidylprolyl isomerase [Deltaproteobacteria bacterium]
MRIHRLLSLSLACGLLVPAGCQKEDSTSKLSNLTPPVGSGSAMKRPNGSGAHTLPTPGPFKDIDSKDILARTETSPSVDVKHVLIGWADLEATYRGRMDPRAKRTNEEAVKLAQEIYQKLKANPDAIDALVKEHSEDPGSLAGTPYTIKADSPFVPEFKNLGIRLKEREVGIVKTNFGYHVMVRVLPPPPDPLESADILARPGRTPVEAGSGSATKPAELETIYVQHVLLGWKELAGRPDPRSAARTKADADKLAKETLDKVRGGADMTKLMKELSEDPGSKDTGKAYEITEKSRMVDPFKNLSLRLKLGEAGLVKTQFGWHVIKRVPQPPPPAPDSLDSTDILKRKPETEKAKVKHILLGWKDVHADDERGKKRERADLEKLVKETMAKLKKGDKIEPLMAELSEDPGSAKTGTDYDVTPTASLVEPFKNLSLRLKVKEVGAVKTDFGIHIIQRTE